MAVVVGIAAMATDVVVYLASLVPGTGTALSAIWPFLFALAFPIFGTAVIVITIRARRDPQPQTKGFGKYIEANARRDDWLSESFSWVRPRVKRAPIVLAVLVAANFAVFAATMPDDPEHDDGRYYADVHGVVQEVSAERYDAIERTGTRGSTGHALMFTALGAALIDGELRRRASERTVG